MCGIAGFVDPARPAARMRLMLTALAHRGPDDCGEAAFGDVHLGHTRLAVIDTSSQGRQPMGNDRGDLCIVFNGEIYNFADLRRQLAPRYHFRSKTDTEVLLYAYQEWGAECLQRLNGMFSFVIYDSRQDLLFGARDRLGEKPLKYFIDDQRFVFASEIKAILQYLGRSPELDPIAIDDFLTLQYVPAPRTGFRGIYKLPPAHYFIYRHGVLQIHRYWHVDYTQQLVLPADEWQRVILQALNRSVASRLVADVPLGALLSGGVDSSAVVALMAQNSGKQVKTFNIGFDSPQWDESPFAQRVAQRYQTDHHSIRLDSSSLLEYLPKVTSHYDEPIGDNSVLPTLLVAKMTSEHVTVALTGDGGDENFGGYTRYNIVKIAQLYRRLPPVIRSKLVRQLSGSLFRWKSNKFTERIDRFVRTSDEPLYSRYLQYSAFFTEETKRQLYAPAFAEQVGTHSTFAFYESLYDRTLDELKNCLKFDSLTYLPEDLLFKTDIAAMAFGLELRSPLLDHEFVELTTKIPADLKVRRGVTKWIFKKALVTHGLLPRELVNRRKQGFNIPQNAWFKGPLKSYIYETILTKKFLAAGIFDRARLTAYLDDYFDTELNYDNNIFALLMLSTWIERYR